MTGDGQVLHDGRRVFAEGRGLWGTLAWLTGCFAFAAVVIVLTRDDVDLPLLLGVAAVAWALFAGWLVLLSRGRVQVTADQVRVRKAFGTQVVHRSSIAEVVHTDHLAVIGQSGYLALLDDQGRALWRGPAQYWPPETVEALKDVGGRLTSEPVLTAPEARERWPQMLPWSLAHPRKAFAAGMGGTFLAILLVALVFWLVLR